MDVVFLFFRRLSLAAVSLHLLLVRSRGTATSGALKLAARGADVRLRGAVWHTRSKAKVADGLTGIAWSLEEDGVLAGGSTSSQLVEGDDLTSGLQDACSSALGDAEGGHRELRHLEKTGVIGDGADNDGDLILASFAAHVRGLFGRNKAFRNTEKSKK